MFWWRLSGQLRRARRGVASARRRPREDLRRHHREGRGAAHRGVRGERRVLRRGARRRLGQHRRHARRSRAARGCAGGRDRLARIRRAEEPRGVARGARLGALARRRRARRRARCAPPSRRSARGPSPPPPRSRSTATRTTSGAGSTTAAGIRSGARGSSIGGARRWGGMDPHDRVETEGPVERLAARQPRALHLRVDLGARGADRPLHDDRRARELAARRPREPAPRCSSIRRGASSACTCCAADSSTGAPGSWSRGSRRTTCS